MSPQSKYKSTFTLNKTTVADPGGAEGAMTPPGGPVKIDHKKDGQRRRPHRFHISRPPPYPAAGSATEPSQPFVTHVLCSYNWFQARFLPKVLRKF